MGGAGSSKSWSVAQWIIRKNINEKNKRTLVTRKTLPSLRITAYKLILDLLRENNIPYKINKSEMVIRTPKNSEILFKSLDEPEKIKSAEFNYIWVEECTEITLDDFRQLNLRLRRTNDLPNQMALTCNPISRLNWVYQELVEKPDTNIGINRSTYKDNLRYLDKEYISQLEGLINQDINYYKIYALGEWGILKDIIYSNYDTIDTLPESFDDVFYGLDFGFNNPSALVKIMVKDNEYYLQEMLYKSGMTNKNIIDTLKEQKITNIIYADTAEPARIEEICQNGFWCKPAEKDVEDGIDYVKRQKLHISSDSTNILKEIGGYKYREDKDGRTLEEPVKFNDHLMDAIRYALYTHRYQPLIMPIGIKYV